jgi:predicted DCC family thiol-disulfide oxidoreductase YuxK
LIKFILKIGIFVEVMEQNQLDWVVFYDGDCGFCNSSVQFILNKRKRDFYFCALQSERAQEMLREHSVEINMDTIYFSKNGKIYDRSSAALQICKGLRGGYPLLVGFYIVPKFIRDGVYNMIAKRRHRIRAGYCALPKEDEQRLFVT